MSGAIAATLLGALTDNSAGNALLSALYGGAAGAAASPAEALQAFQTAELNQTQDIAATAAQPSVARDVAAFKAGIASATSADTLLSNPAVLKVLLTANGLGDQLAYPALAKKALLSNTADTNSLADTLGNASWKSAASTYDFATQGLAVIRQPAVQQKLADAYAEVQWRQSLDAAHPGLSNALTFRAEAATITSVDQVLGDPILRDVVTTTLGLPLDIAVQPLEAQETAITSRLDLKQFSDPAFVDRFTQRYLVTKASDATAASTPDLTTLATEAAGLVV